MNWLILAGLVVLPWTTLVPLYQFPPAVAAANSPVILWSLGMVLGVAVWIARQDRWLGVFVALTALNALRAPWPARPWSTVHAVVLGVLLLLVVRALREPWPARIRVALVGGALLQVFVAGLQRLGLDPLWPVDAPFKASGTMNGSFGNDTWLGAYLALVGAVAPGWAIPPIVLGLLLAQNRLGLVALAIALVVRYRREWFWLACAWPLAAVTIWWVSAKSLDSVWGRFGAWRLGLEIWWPHAKVFGLGPGGWAWYVPQWQAGERFLQAHNEWLQLLVEGGIAAMVVLWAWLWAHRRALLPSPAVWALAVLCVGSFPLHVGPVGVTAVVLVGLATVSRRDSDG